MGNLGIGEMLVILLIALLVFGPQKLPEIARNLGRALRAFQQEAQRASTTLRSAVEQEARERTPGVIDRPDAPPAVPAPAAEQPAEDTREQEDT